jgi:hypothetical protein
MYSVSPWIGNSNFRGPYHPKFVDRYSKEYLPALAAIVLE